MVRKHKNIYVFSIISWPSDDFAWWRHRMETCSALLALCTGNSPVTGEFPSQMPVTRSFYVFFDLRLIKPSSKQSWGWWFETLSRPLWRHCNGYMKSLLMDDNESFNLQSQYHGWWCSGYFGRQVISSHGNDLVISVSAPEDLHLSDHISTRPANTRLWKLSETPSLIYHLTFGALILETQFPFVERDRSFADSYFFTVPSVMPTWPINSMTEGQCCEAILMFE